MTVDPQQALRMYAGNVENFNPASPVLVLIGETVVPIVLHLEDEAQAPLALTEVGRNPEFAGYWPLDQVLLNVEVTTVPTGTPDGPMSDAVCIYSVGVEDYRLLCPFSRTDGPVVWHDGEVLIGDDLWNDPVMVALRNLQGAHA